MLILYQIPLFYSRDEMIAKFGSRIGSGHFPLFYARSSLRVQFSMILRKKIPQAFSLQYFLIERYDFTVKFILAKFCNKLQSEIIAPQ